VDRPHDAVLQSKAAFSSLRRYVPKGRETDFRSRIANIALRDLALHANASEPVRAEMAPSEGLFFIMTLEGICRTEVERARYEVVPERKAVLLTERDVRYGESGARSIFVARLDPIRLSETARAMSGATKGGKNFPLDQAAARVIELQDGPLNHAGAMRSLFGLIDTYFDAPAILDTLGVDDLFYRQIALMVWPRLCLNAGHAPAGRDAASLDELCAIIRERLERPLTITEMEKITGLSGRALQYAFNKRFGCAPMTWQKRERLHLARALLASSDETVNIAALSAQFGFSSPSRFAKYYKEMFGVSPSARRG
jgi:AraC-like DNA-binding protein